jgi:putative transposase
LIKKNSAYVPKGVEYPYFKEPFAINNIHQADLVGPRYIKGDGKILFVQCDRCIFPSSIHRITTQQAGSESRQQSIAVLEGHGASRLPANGQRVELSRIAISIPDPSVWLSGFAFILVFSRCLSQFAEPWRNGVIEKFNDTYSKKFFRRQWFHSYARR